MSMARHASLLTVVAAASMAVGLTDRFALATDVSVPLSNNSLEVQFNSGANPTAYKASQAQVGTGMRIGYQSQYWQTANDPAGASTNGGMNAVLYFQLPAIPAGQQLSSAALNFSLLATLSGAEPAFNVDLYAIGYDKNDQPLTDGADGTDYYNQGGIVSTTVAPAYFYMPTANTDVQSGPAKVANANGTITTDSSLPITRIQDNVLSSTQDGSGKTQWDYAKAAPDGQLLVSTSSVGSSNLLSYIESLYADPNFTPGHDYLILRMNPDQKATGSAATRYQIPYAQTDSTSGATSTDATAPTLSLSFAAATHFPGDTNNDGVVDLTDLNNVLNNFGSTGAGNPGDDDSSGVVDLTDLNNVLNNFGSTHAAGSLGVVPEPAGLMFLALGVPTLLARRRHRHA
jgi:hypothetical protein